jgi:hypothetical protein
MEAQSTRSHPPAMVAVHRTARHTLRQNGLAQLLQEPSIAVVGVEALGFQRVKLAAAETPERHSQPHESRFQTEKRTDC